MFKLDVVDVRLAVERAVAVAFVPVLHFGMVFQGHHKFGRTQGDVAGNRRAFEQLALGGNGFVDEAADFGVGVGKVKLVGFAAQAEGFVDVDDFRAVGIQHFA